MLLGGSTKESGSSKETKIREHGVMKIAKEECIYQPRDVQQKNPKISQK